MKIKTWVLINGKNYITQKLYPVKVHYWYITHLLFITEVNGDNFWISHGPSHTIQSTTCCCSSIHIFILWNVLSHKRTDEQSNSLTTAKQWLLILLIQNPSGTNCPSSLNRSLSCDSANGLTRLVKCNIQDGGLLLVDGDRTLIGWL